VGDLGSGQLNSAGQDCLVTLLAEVRRTRRQQRETQQLTGANAMGMVPARRASLRALEAYASALGERGWPVPSRMRLEIQLLQSLCGVDALGR
jgi:hypothetical protein